MSSEENPTTESNFSEEIDRLGENLRKTINTLWSSKERKSATESIEKGADEIGQALEKLAQEISQSGLADQVRRGVDELQTKFKNSELESRIRKDAVETLRKVNQELSKFAARWEGTQDSPAETPDNDNL